ncbi:MAG: metalloregulator ArsR/SmtB family transcription factor [Rhodobacteraceae bacterium]|nr:metalloregulator ArsR/SmtB family transcription factor [Paracoccaceae bacterium]
MSYQEIIAALADPTRRALVERLRGGPQPVRTLAEGMTVSRPAVSQHLKVLRDAGLVLVEPKGTRRIYRLAPGGLDELRRWLDSFAPLAPEITQEDQMPGHKADNADTPITRTVRVPLPPARAFDLFTREMADWWPLDTHSISAQSGQTAKTVVVTPEPGGPITETKPDGTTTLWGRVTEWQPGRAFAMAWHVGRPASQATKVRLSFDVVAGGTRVTLVHSGWQALGAEATVIRVGYLTGWDSVFCTRFAACCRTSSAAV